MQTISHLRALSGRTDLSNYIGFYYEYYYAMSFPDKILRSLVHVEQKETGIFYTRHERLAPVGQHNRGARCRYVGELLFLKHKVYCIDFESISNAEISLTIFHPVYWPVIDTLDGLKIGTNTGAGSEPRSRKVVWEFLGRSPNAFKLLRNIGLLEQGDPSIDQSIKDKLT